LIIAVGTLLTAGAALLTARSTQQQLRAAQQQVQAAQQQNQAMQFGLSVATLEHLEDEFESPRMWKTRREAAAALLRHQETRAVDDVLDFFETVALLVHRDALDPKMVWNTFYYWIDGYLRSSDPVTVQERRQHPVEWKELDALREQLERIESEKGGARQATSPDELHEFLVDESTLK
jgi:type II secretory pathway pseudopilin PulG